MSTNSEDEDDDEPDWKIQYQYALANFFAMAEVVSNLRTDENTAHIDRLIDAAGETWQARAEARFFKIPDSNRRREVRTRYRVVWTMDIEASTPREAAEEALAIHRDPASIATEFEVFKPPLYHTPQYVDLGTDD